MPKSLRGFLIETLYVDLDLVNCHFAILDFLSHRYGISSPSISKYVLSKTKCFESFGIVAKDAAKVHMISIINGMPLNKRMLELAAKPFQEKWKGFLNLFQKEIRSLIEKSINIDSTLWDLVVKDTALNYKVKEPYKLRAKNLRRYSHYLLSSWENLIIMSTITKFNLQKNVVPFFDGFLLEKSKYTPRLMVKLNDFIKTRYSPSLTLVLKQPKIDPTLVGFNFYKGKNLEKTPSEGLTKINIHEYLIPTDSKKDYIIYPVLEVFFATKFPFTVTCKNLQEALVVFKKNRITIDRSKHVVYYVDFKQPGEYLSRFRKRYTDLNIHDYLTSSNTEDVYITYVDLYNFFIKKFPFRVSAKDIQKALSAFKKKRVLIRGKKYIIYFVKLKSPNKSLSRYVKRYKKLNLNKYIENSNSNSIYIKYSDLYKFFTTKVPYNLKVKDFQKELSAFKKKRIKISGKKFIVYYVKLKDPKAYKVDSYAGLKGK